MKLLTRYILKEHFAPFLFAFFTITFLLVIDYVPKIVNHVIDKDISTWVALELVALNLAWMLALSVPMSVLVATLMAFGRMTSDLEIIAIKSSGINLMRMIIPVLTAGFIITLLMVQFNDKVLPDLNKQARELWGNISRMRPTLVFRSGIFITDIPGYLIQIDKIDHTTSRVDGVSISKTTDENNPKIVIAEYGYLEMTDNGRNMRFTLYNGEIHTVALEKPEEYRKVDFEEQVINIADASSELIRTETQNRGDREMNIADMRAKVDKAKDGIIPHREKIINNLKSKFNYLYSEDFNFYHADTLSDTKTLLSVKNDAINLNNYVHSNKIHIDSKKKTMFSFLIEIHKKYAIPAASLAFILIGAPLGVISRKGGMGVSIGISIALFIFYWGFLIGGEDISDRKLMSPFLAMWSANFLVGGLGIYLLYKVITEKQFFSYFRRNK